MNIHKDRQSFKETKPIAQIIEPLEIKIFYIRFSKWNKNLMQKISSKKY